MSAAALAQAAAAIRQIAPVTRYGSVVGVRGGLLEICGLGDAARVGARLRIASGSQDVLVEIAGMEGGRALCAAFSDIAGIATGARALLVGHQAVISPDDNWLGRVIDGLARPVDGRGALSRGVVARVVRGGPPNATARARVGRKIATGVRALDIFTPVCVGQRLGLFAGSGVGKSVLLSMLARFTDCDVAVIGLIGERGREVKEFIEDDLGADGLAKAVVVVATSDEPALMRREAAYMTLAIAEHFRDQGKHVLCLMDSVTRFAMAQREIGLAAGEPPASKGYTPTVFAELPRLLERAGPGLEGSGSITGLFTVLVDGGDHDEPVADAVRGILDGHVVMPRAIAERGRYPAVDVLKSVSRTLPRAHSDEQNRLLKGAKQVLSTWADMEELVRLGAYQPGASADVDRAIALAPRIEVLLGQGKDECGDVDEVFANLAAILELPK